MEAYPQEVLQPMMNFLLQVDAVEAEEEEVEDEMEAGEAEEEAVEEELEAVEAAGSRVAQARQSATVESRAGFDSRLGLPWRRSAH